MSKEERNATIYRCHKENLSQKQIGKLFNLSQSAISKILIQLKSGLPLRKKETRGSKAKITEGDKDKLKEILLKPPSDYNYWVWNKWSIKALIEKEFGVIYHENYIYKIMRLIGFSSQKPKQKDYRQNADLVEKFKAEKAGAIKKRQYMKKDV